MFRLVGALEAVLALAIVGSARAAHAQETDRSSDSRIALFVNFPMTNGFADATEALVDAYAVVHDSLHALDNVRLVDRIEESDAMLTLLGRGVGHAELTEGLNALDPGVLAPRVMISPAERYIEAMITVGSCAQAPKTARDQAPLPPCYRKVFVGLGLADRPARPGIKGPPRNSWNVCAGALARDVQAWVAENTARLLARRR